MSELYTCIQAVEYIKNKIGRAYNAKYFRTKCARGEFEAVKMGRDWLIYKQSLDDFEPSKPGLKVGQKINRRRENKTPGSTG